MKNLTKKVKAKYSSLAQQAKSGQASCSTVTEHLYGDEAARMPQAAINASLGSGNPTTLAHLRDGQTVLDLGSGGGLDVLLAADRVGPSGKVYGLDMTEEMLSLARENQKKAGVTNVEFLKGNIEQIPLPDSTVDVIISNCAINLSTDKRQVFREAFRVLKPGGEFAVSDIVREGSVPREAQEAVEQQIGCIAGTLAQDQYRSGLAAVGFASIEIQPAREHGAGLISALIRAQKPLDPKSVSGTP